MRIGGRLLAGASIDLIGGEDPVEVISDGSPNYSGISILTTGSAVLETSQINSEIKLDGIGPIELLAASHNWEIVADSWAVTQDGKLTEDVTLFIEIDRGDFVYSGTALITVAAAAENEDLNDLLDDIQAALEAGNYTIIESSNVAYAVGSEFTEFADDPSSVSVVDPDMIARLRDGKVVLTSAYEFNLADGLVDANEYLVGFDLSNGSLASAEFRNVIADTLGSRVILGDPQGINGSVTVSAEILAYESIELNGGAAGTVLVNPCLLYTSPSPRDA